MIEQIITSSVLILGVCLVRFLSGKRISFCVRYALWLLVAVKLLVPLPGLESKCNIMNVVLYLEESLSEHRTEESAFLSAAGRRQAGAGETNPAAENVGMGPMGETEAVSFYYREGVTRPVYGDDGSGSLEGAQHSVRLWKVAGVLWLAGVLALCVAFLWCNLCFRGKVIKSRQLKGRYRKVEIYSISEKISPCLYGVFRPAVYIPQELADIGTEKMRYILAHEYTHYRHWDHLWTMIRCLCVILYWYHPLVWLAAVLSAKDGELACDEGTLQTLGEENARFYGRVILEVLYRVGERPGGAPLFTCTTSMAGGIKEMRKRMRMIAERPKKKRIAVAATALACATLAGCTMGGVKEEPEQEVTIQYHADDGEFDGTVFEVEATEDAEGAEENGKTILTFVVSGLPGRDSSYQKLVNAFNNESEQYYVELTKYDFGDELVDIRTKLSMEIGSGKGPDIMFEDVFPVNQAVLEKGVLVDLSPYLLASDITEDKYFPSYAAIVSDGKIYGIAPSVSPSRMVIEQKVLESWEVPDIATLTDKLLEYPEKGTFVNEYQDGSRILEYLLGGSETLWGMVDWEARKCDFSGELFSKMLDLAKRYAQDREMGYEPVVDWTSEIECLNGTMEAMGKVLIDYYFDDGTYPLLKPGEVLMINANTDNLDGAWAFLSFVMSKKGQNLLAGTPSHRELWREKQLFDIQHGLRCYLADGTQVEPTEEDIDELEEVNNRARYYPRKTETILNIIYEEADAYFTGNKSKEEVIEIIQNRVQLLLNEG